MLHYLDISFAWSYMSEAFCTQDRDKNETWGGRICKIAVGSAGASQNFSCPEPSDLYKMAFAVGLLFSESESHLIGFICRNVCLFRNLRSVKYPHIPKLSSNSSYIYYLFWARTLTTCFRQCLPSAWTGRRSCKQPQLPASLAWPI